MKDMLEVFTGIQILTMTEWFWVLVLVQSFDYNLMLKTEIWCFAATDAQCELL